MRNFENTYKSDTTDAIINNPFFTDLILTINNRLTEENLQGYKDFYELLKSKLINISDLEIMMLLKIFEHNINFCIDPNLNYTAKYIDDTKRLIFEYYRSDGNNKIEVLKNLHGLTQIELENYAAAQHLGLQNRVNSPLKNEAIKK